MDLCAVVRLLLLLALASGLVGCGRQAEEPAPSGRTGPRSGGTLKLALPAPRTLDPARLTTVYEASVINQVFDGLLAWDLNLAPVPALARQWTITEGGRKYVFVLNEDVRFQDGTRLEASDVVFSIERYLELSRGQVSATLDVLRGIEGARLFDAGRASNVSGLRAEGPSVVQIRLEQPDKALLPVLASDSLKVLPRRVVERLGENFGQAPLGTGPYRLERWERGGVIELTTFEGHFRGPPLLERLVFDTDPGLVGERQIEAFLRGELDVIQANSEVLEAIQQHGPYPTIQRIEPSLFYLGFNLTKPPFDRRELRQAISLAVDRSAVADAMRPWALPADGIIPGGMPGCPPPRTQSLHDEARARTLLSDGGEPPSSVDIWVHDPVEGHRLMVEQLRSAGIPAVLKEVSWEELDRASEDGRAGAFLLGVVVDLPEARCFLFDSFHSRGAGNFYGYASKRLDDLLKQSGDETDSKRRALLLGQAETVVLEDAPVVPLFRRVNLVALQPWVKGLELNPFGLGDVAFERVWLERP